MRPGANIFLTPFPKKHTKKNMKTGFLPTKMTHSKKPCEWFFQEKKILEKPIYWMNEAKVLVWKMINDSIVFYVVWVLAYLQPIWFLTFFLNCPTFALEVLLDYILLQDSIEISYLNHLRAYTLHSVPNPEKYILNVSCLVLTILHFAHQHDGNVVCISLIYYSMHRQSVVGHTYVARSS